MFVVIAIVVLNVAYVVKLIGLVWVNFSVNALYARQEETILLLCLRVVIGEKGSLC